MSQPFTKFNYFVEDLAKKIHNLSADQLKVALTDTVPVVTNHVLADLTEISYANLSSRNITISSCVQTSGVLNLLLNNVTLTASGAVAQFRYAVIYNSTPAGGNLIGWYDYTSEVSMVNGDTFAISFDAVNGAISIT